MYLIYCHGTRGGGVRRRGNRREAPIQEKRMTKKSAGCVAVRSGRRAAALLLVMAVSAALVFAGGCSSKSKGGKNGKQFPNIQLLYNTSEAHKAIAEAIQQMWQKELGIKVTLTNAEWKVYLKNLSSGDYNIARSSWIADYSDPNTYLDMFVTGGGNNQTGWSNKQYDDLLDAALKEVDPRKRYKILNDAENILVNDEVPIMPIYYYVCKNLLKKNVKNFQFNVRDIHPLKEVYMEKAGKPAPPAGQHFRFNLGTEPETIDPALMTGVPEAQLAFQLFEGLVVNDPKTLEPKPGCAEKWEISPDGLVYTFHLRKGLKWSNGDPLTAEDFFYSWKRVLEPKTASEYVYQMFYIKNGKQYFEGKIKDFSQVGLKVIDPLTIQVTLENPTHFWLDLMAFHTAAPVNKKCVEKYGDRWTRPENIVTNGPFLLKSWIPKDKMIMVKNPGYYDADKVKLQKITISTIEDTITSVHMFEANQTDWVNTIPPTYIDKVKKEKWPEAYFTPYLGSYFYRFNVRKPPFNDKRVRMALNLAVNKEEICKYVTKAGEKPAMTLVPLAMPNYPQVKGQEYNPERARQLLREAGYAVNVK